MKATITYYRDKAAGVWIATSEAIPGLILEHEDRDSLEERVREAVPELMEENLWPRIDHSIDQADRGEVLTLEEAITSIDKEFDL